MGLVIGVKDDSSVADMALSCSTRVSCWLVTATTFKAKQQAPTQRRHVRCTTAAAAAAVVFVSQTIHSPPPPPPLPTPHVKCTNNILLSQESLHKSTHQQTAAAKCHSCKRSQQQVVPATKGHKGHVVCDGQDQLCHHDSTLAISVTHKSLETTTTSTTAT